MKRIGFFLVCMLTACAPLLFVACEAESTSDQQLNLEPRSATLKPKQSAVFTVSGGYDYRWSLSDERLGALNKRTGNQVIYTATSTNSGVQELTVQTFIEGASGNNPTNAMGEATDILNNATVKATITQIGTGSTLPPTVTTLTITPSTAVLTAGDSTVTFTVAEGVSASWRVTNVGLGDPDIGNGTTFTYTGLSFPSNAVTQTIEASYLPPGGSVITKTVTVTQRFE